MIRKMFNFKVTTFWIFSFVNIFFLNLIIVHGIEYHISKKKADLVVNLLTTLPPNA